jgi:hypothetical protein
MHEDNSDQESQLPDYEDSRYAKSQEGSIRIGPATSVRSLCQAFGLVYREYLRCGYLEPDAIEMRYSLLNVLPTSKTFVAQAGGRVVGTATLVVSSPAGLPSSEVFSQVFKELERSGRKVAEATMFSVDATIPRANTLALRIMPWLLAWAVSQLVEDICVVVNPRHVRFWERTLGFARVGEPKTCNHVCGHPGLLLRLPIDELLDGRSQATTATRCKGIERMPATREVCSGYRLRDADVLSLLARRPTILHSLTPGQWACLRRHHPHAAHLLGLLDEVSPSACAA